MAKKPKLQGHHFIGVEKEFLKKDWYAAKPALTKMKIVAFNPDTKEYTTEITNSRGTNKSTTSYTLGDMVSRFPKILDEYEYDTKEKPVKRTNHPKCKTCRYFSLDDYPAKESPITGVCSLTPHTDPYAKAEQPAKDLYTAYVEDGSSYSASLYVSPDHYCAMHRPEHEE